MRASGVGDGEMNGIVGLWGVKSASAERKSGRIGSISAVWEATSMLTRCARKILALRRGDHGLDLLRRPADHGLMRRGIHRQGDVGVVGDQLLGGGRSSSSSAIAPCPASRDINRDRVAITRSPSAAVSAPATTAADTSPIECPITASGSTP